IDTLPLAKDERLPAPAVAPPPGDEPEWRKFLREAWAEVKGLVRVEVADRPAAPLVPPPQQYFLRENLRLRLLSARIALLNRDAASFRADLSAADEWVKQYFDTRQKNVQMLQATLKQLAGTPMAADLPDLTRSFEALRVLRLAQDRAPGRATANPAGRGRRGPAGPVLVLAARRCGGGRGAGSQAADRLRAVRRAAVSRRA